MVNVRRGINIRVGFSVYRNGIPEDLTQAQNLRVVIRHKSLPNSSAAFTGSAVSILGNSLSVVVTDTMQKIMASGDYIIEVVYRLINPAAPEGYDPYIIDSDVFTLTDRSSDVGGVSCGDVTVQVVNLTGEVSFCSQALEQLIDEAIAAVQAANEAAQAANDAADAAMAIVDSKVDIDGLNANVKRLQFDTANPTAPMQIGQIAWDNDEHTLVTHDGLHSRPLGKELELRARNTSGATILNGRACYVTGSTGDNPTIGLATNTNGDVAQKTIGVATMDIANNAFGIVTTFGEVNDIDTSGLTLGAIVYLGANGTLTTTEPVAPTPKIVIGVCVRQHAQVGKLFVSTRPIARLSKLSEVHAPTLTDNDVLRWNGTTLRWEVYSLANKADLVGGKVPTSQLPSYVDDVLEYASLAAFPATGETSKIYVALNTNLTYRWSGTAYVEISKSLALGETADTAYRGDRGKTAYDHSQTTGNPHSTTAAQIPNTPAGTVAATTVQGAINELASDIVQVETDLNNTAKYIDRYQQSELTYSSAPYPNNGLFVKASPIVGGGKIISLSFAQPLQSQHSTKLVVCELSGTMKILRIYDLVVSGNIVDVSNLNIEVNDGEYVGLVSSVVNNNFLYKIKASGLSKSWWFNNYNVVIGNSSSSLTVNPIEYDFSFDVISSTNTVKSHIEDIEENINTINEKFESDNKYNDTDGDLAILRNTKAVDSLSSGYSKTSINNPIVGLKETTIDVYTKNSGVVLYPVRFLSSGRSGEFGLWFRKSDYVTIRLQVAILSIGKFTYVDFNVADITIGMSKGSTIAELSIKAQIIEVLSDYCFVKITYESTSNNEISFLPYDFGSGGNSLNKGYSLYCYVGKNNPYNIDRKISVSNIVERSLSKYDGVKLYLPTLITCEVGKPLYVFKNSITDAFNYKNYNIQVLLSANKSDGDDYNRYWMYTAQSVGTVIATFNLYNNSRKLLDSKQVIIKAVNKTTSPISQKTILFIGDSLTYYNRITDEFYRVLTSSDMSTEIADTLSIYNVKKPSGRSWGNINLIGTQKINFKGWVGQTYHEGRSGWAWSNFIGTSSPFYNSGALDFNNYLNVNGFIKPDVVYIGLGWNDLSLIIGESYDATQIVQNARTFLNAMVSQWSNTKIRLWTENVPGANGGIGNHPYGSTEWADEQRLKKSMLTLCEAYKTFETEFTNVRVVSATSQIDSEYALQESKANVNSRIAFEETRGVDYVHPADAGFFQIADSLIADFCEYLG